MNTINKPKLTYRTNKVDKAIKIHEMPRKQLVQLYLDIMQYENTGEKSLALREYYRDATRVARNHVHGVANWEMLVKESILLEVITRLMEGVL